MTTAMHRLGRRLLLHGCYLSPFVGLATFLWGCLAEGTLINKKFEQCVTLTSVWIDGQSPITVPS